VGEEVIPGIQMSVNIDETRHNVKAGDDRNLLGAGSGNIGSDTGDLAGCDSYIHDTVTIVLRIDDVPAL
jgi:hypothetical protein